MVDILAVGQTLYRKSTKKLVIILKIYKDSEKGWRYKLRDEAGEVYFESIKNHSEYTVISDKYGDIYNGRDHRGFMLNSSMEEYTSRSVMPDTNLRGIITEKPVMPKKKKRMSSLEWSVRNVRPMRSNRR